jgi:hypothetical protein
MARVRGRAPVRARSERSLAHRGRKTHPRRGRGETNSSAVPRVLLDAVDRVEIVAGGALRFARDVLMSTASGAAYIGTEAFTTTLAITRGVVSAGSRMVGDMVGTAETTFLATADTAKRSPRDQVLLEPRRPTASMAARPEGRSTAAPVRPSRQRRRAGRPGAAARPHVAA